MFQGMVFRSGKRFHQYVPFKEEWTLIWIITLHTASSKYNTQARNRQDKAPWQGSIPGQHQDSIWPSMNRFITIKIAKTNMTPATVISNAAKCSNIVLTVIPFTLLCLNFLKVRFYQQRNRKTFLFCKVISIKWHIGKSLFLKETQIYSSSPRKRGSSAFILLGSRFRGNDETE